MLPFAECRILCDIKDARGFLIALSPIVEQRIYFAPLHWPRLSPAACWHRHV
jgi:hypothetical protein